MCSVNINELRDILKIRLSKKRYTHSLNVADAALKLAEKYGVFTVLPTHTNFAVLRTEKCTEIFEELKKRSICVRCFPKFQMLRITTGSEQENVTLLTELEDICADMQA